jgi:hypothetical protein
MLGGRADRTLCDPDVERVDRCVGDVDEYLLLGRRRIGDGLELERSSELVQAGGAHRGHLRARSYGGAMEHLTHGWEPDLDEGDSLLRRFVLASGHRSMDLAARAGGRTRATPWVTMADAASPVVFDNIAVLLQPPTYIDLDTTLESVVSFYPPDRHFVVLSAWPTPDLSRFGLVLMGHPPLMYRPIGGEAPPAPAELEIRLVDDEAGLEDFVTTLIEAYPMPGAEGTPSRIPPCSRDRSGCSSATSTAYRWARPVPASDTA